MIDINLQREKTRFLLLERLHDNARQTLHAAGFPEVDCVETALDEAALIERIKGVHFLGIRSRTQITEKVLEAADKLMGIGCFCIGTNQVDLDAARRRGIPVFNAPYSNTRSVAELVLGEIILLLRGIFEKNHYVHQGTWPKAAQGAYEARGKILGIIGYGNIGSQLSVLAESLGMQVIYYDVVTKLPLGNAKQVPSLDTLLAQSDVVSLHVPQENSTHNMMSHEQFSQMKPGAIFINAARGSCVVIDDLASAIRSRHLGGAAIDVFPSEPKSNDEALDSSLRGLPNVVLTPHIGGSTVEAQANIGLEVAEKFVQYAISGKTITAVNFPEVSIPKTDNTHRLLHIHENRPGVLSSINQLFAEHQINICAQSLMTKDDIGYLIMDVNDSDSDIALEKMRSIDGTIRVRLLY